MTTFAEVVDAAERLPLDEQLILVKLLRRRIAERNRAELVRDVQAARAEFASGQAGPASVDQIMKEARGEA